MVGNKLIGFEMDMLSVSQNRMELVKNNWLNYTRSNVKLFCYLIISLMAVSFFYSVVHYSNTKA